MSKGKRSGRVPGEAPRDSAGDWAVKPPASPSPPVSGFSAALGAGAAFAAAARERGSHARTIRRSVRLELPAYLAVQASWFFAFGLQMVLFPYLITNKLGLDGLELGLANVALAAPSVLFLLLGGVVAERADAKKLLILLHLAAALPAVSLALAVGADRLSYTAMLVYGVAIGTVGAFMMPARDSVVNEVVERRIRTGSSVTLQFGVTLATMAQFVAQVGGLVLAGYADKMTRLPVFLGRFAVGPIPSEALLAAQGAVLAIGALFAFGLARGRKVNTGNTGMASALKDIKSGYRAVRADPVIWSMTVLMFGVGVFVIGAFLVVLPLVNRDVYGLESDGIRDMFVTFWLGAFVSAVALSVFKQIERQGRLLLLAQLLGSLAILVMLNTVPHYVFLGVVFVWGLAAGVSITMSRAIVQQAAPKDQLARVLSIYQLGFMAGAPFGAALMGVLVDMLGPRLIAVVPAGGMVMLIVYMVARTPLWGMGQGGGSGAVRESG